MIEVFSQPDAWLALLSLTALEIVLGIDNIVFIAILAERVPEDRRSFTYRVGLAGAMITRILLLLAISWVMGLTETLFTVLGEQLSGRDLILLGGGLFLIAKSAHEIFEKVEGIRDEVPSAATTGRKVAWIIVQIMLLDIVFSLDSVITAVGMAKDIEVMVVAVMIAVGVMMVSAKPIGEFVNKNPAIKILALSFLLLIGVLLTAEAFDRHIGKGYIYFAMGYALLIELLHMRRRRNIGGPKKAAPPAAAP